MSPLSIRTTLFSGTLALLVTAVPAAGQGLNMNEPEPIDETIPMEIGTEWTYAGTAWWTSRRGREVFVENVKWKMRVVDAFEHEEVRAAALEGHPFDLIWYDKDRIPGKYLLAQTPEGKVYLLRDRDADAVVAYIHGEPIVEAEEESEEGMDSGDEEEEAGKIDLETLLTRGELLLDLPLFVGKRYCTEPPEDVTEQQCWTVVNESPTALPGVRGVRAADDTQLATLSLRTRMRHAISGFVRGVGFTSFSAGHAGDAPSAVELRLVEVVYGDGEVGESEPNEAAAEEVDPTQETATSR